MKKSRKWIAVTLVLPAVLGAVYLAISRGWVFAQTSSPPPHICSKATLKGEFALIFMAMHEGLNTSNGSAVPSFGVNNFRATANFDGAGTVTVSSISRVWSVAGQPLLFPGGARIEGRLATSQSYHVFEDCAGQMADQFIQVFPGPQPGNRTFLLIDGVTAAVDFVNIGPGTQSKTIAFVGIGISK